MIGSQEAIPILMDKLDSLNLFVRVTSAKALSKWAQEKLYPS